MLTSVRHFACAGENKGTESKTERESLAVGRDHDVTFTKVIFSGCN